MLQGKLPWAIDVFLSLYVLLTLGFFPPSIIPPKEKSLYIFMFIIDKHTDHIDQSLNYFEHQNNLHECLLNLQSQIQKREREI